MLKERARLIAVALWMADLALIAVAFCLAHMLRAGPLVTWGFAGRTLPLGAYLPLLPVALAIWGAFLLRGGYFRSHRMASMGGEIWEIVRLSLLAALTFIVGLFVLRLDELLLGGYRISRLWLFSFFVLAVALLAINHSLLRLASRLVRRLGYNYRTAVIVGLNPTAMRIADSIEHHQSWGVHILGFVRAGERENDQAAAAGYPILGELDGLLEIVEREVVDEVFIAVNRQELEKMGEILLALEEQGISARLALNLFPDVGSRLEVGELEGLPLLSYHTTPQSLLLLVFKRAADILLTAVLLVVTAPLLLAIAAAIRFSMGAPVVYRQQRCGLNGRTFTLYKFRTMADDAEQSLGELAHLNEMAGPVFKMRRDPRVTRLGRLLRRFSLDELPQLWNVLKGDMSLVGPRPPIPQEVDNYERWQRRRLSMRPGLTCLWQIGGRNEIDFDRWMELDLEYIDHWSPFLDLKILARTIPAVLSGRGAS